MAATQTVPQQPQHCNFSLIRPRLGVITLFGHGISLTVDRGHLVLKDGVATERREARLARVKHGLRRVVVIGADGFVSLPALRWLADQRAAFVMLERDGEVLATTGPVSSADSRLRRAQSLALHSGVALEVSRGLITQKLAAQLDVLRNRFETESAVSLISKMLGALSTAKSHDEIRVLESQAAAAYWSAWRKVPINFPHRDLSRIPDHWRSFGARISPLTGSPRLAVNPPNAMLNYLYALLESESVLAVAALGLDPGIGVLHMDKRNRNSLACDVMEPVRPKVDALVLDWLAQGPLRREWFFEERNGNARLMAALASRLSETMPLRRSHVAPVAECVARSLWTSSQKPQMKAQPPTRLTQAHRRAAKGSSFGLQRVRASRVSVCRNCGKEIDARDKFCADCAPDISRENLIKAAHAGRIATISEAAQEKRAATQRRQAAALKAVPVPTIRDALAVSELYATNIRNGKSIPHPRHWLKLVELVSI